jgi:hypothetical protein
VKNALADNDALKAAVKVQKDEGDFVALAAEDTVAVTNDTLVITFANSLEVSGGAAYAFKINEGALKDAAGNKNAAITTAKINVSDTTAPEVTQGEVDRTSDTEATVKFTSNEAGVYYIEVVDKDAAAPAIDTTGAGTACTTEETTANVTLTAGDKDVYVVVKDAAGNVSEAVKFLIDAY